MSSTRFGRSWSQGVALGLLFGILGPGFVHAGDDDATSASPPRNSSALRKLPEIDRLLREAWKKAELQPSPPAGDDEFLRRAYLDTLGRIPTLAETQAFFAGRDADKRAKLIDYLLEHPDYAKNQATLWRVALIGRQNQERRVEPKMLIDWLRKQFAANRPWNELAYDLITAEGSNKENGAVNYTMAHLENGAVNLTAYTTRIFLGRQIQCTQCHDHPSNDWKQADFWGINAFFKGVRRREVRKEDSTNGNDYDHTEVFDEPTDAFSEYERRDARMGIMFPTFLDGRKVGQGRDVERRKALARFITEPTNTAFAEAFVNRTWGHYFGRGIVNPIDDFGDHNEPSVPEVLDLLAKEFKESGFDVRLLTRRIMNSEAYQLTSRATKSNEKDESLFTHMTLKPMSPEQLFESLLVATSAHESGTGDRDNIEQRRDAWFRQFQTAFANDEGEETTSFQGTIPQALMMMNGPLMAEAVGGRPGSFLAELLERARLQRGAPVDAYVVQNLYLAALSRPPSKKEMTNARAFLAGNPDTIQVMEDLFWALLNSNEFILNR